MTRSFTPSRSHTFPVRVVGQDVGAWKDSAQKVVGGSESQESVQGGDDLSHEELLARLLARNGRYGLVGREHGSGRDCVVWLRDREALALLG